MHSNHPHRAVSLVGVVALTTVVAAGPAGDAHGTDAHGSNVRGTAAAPTQPPGVATTGKGDATVIDRHGRTTSRGRGGPGRTGGARGPVRVRVGEWSPASATSHATAGSGSAEVVDDLHMAWPAAGKVTSEYGQRWGRLHAGIDIGAPSGAPVRAAADGRVAFAGTKGGYGHTVIIAHGDRTRTLYAHLSAARVEKGDRVARGARIGAVGSTGSSTGPHLHFEVHERGDTSDPRDRLVARR